MFTERALAFGPFRLDARTRSLTEDGRPVAIGDRALDLLIALIEHAGEVISSADLMARAWSGRFVDDANLRVQVSALRRALRDEGADPAYVATASGGVDPAVSVAASLGLRFLHNPTANLAAYVAPLELLIIIDGCEYAVDATAELAAAVLREAPRAVVLATSREPLRADGEVVWRVEPLALPVEPPPSADEALSFGAIRLFADRAKAADRAFHLAEADIRLVTNICRRLDGVPLAIELAAGRVPAFGLAGVERGLDQRFHLLSEGRRTAPPRHRTLAAAVDWSYDSMSEAEQKALASRRCKRAPSDVEVFRDLVAVRSRSPSPET